MSQKDQMIKDILTTHSKYGKFLEMVGVPETTFLKWLYKFKTYDEIRKANNFIHGTSENQPFTKKSLLRALMIFEAVWNRFKPEEWDILIGLGGSHPQLKDLSYVKRELKTIWTKRPKPPRRGGE